MSEPHFPNASPDAATAMGPAAGGGSAVVAGFLGWTLDAFDYFLVVMSLTAIGRDFHKTDKEMALVLATTLAFRPLGALIFGLLADRYGRRIPLMVDLIFFSVIEVMSGLAPNFETFLILRALFGIGMGGEWGVGASLTMEKVPPKLRGLLSGLLQEGYAAGYLLAAVAYFVVFPRWGWRPLFFIGGLPALLAVFVRFNVQESEVWHRSKTGNWKGIFTGVIAQWRIFLYLIALMTMLNLSSHGTQDLFPTFLERDWHFDPQKKSAITAFSMVGAILGGLLFGRVSDQIGRRRAIVLAFMGASAAVYFWALPSSVVMLVIGAFLLQFMVQGAWGVIPAHICELSPDNIRGVMPGFAYQCGNLIASYISPLEATFAVQYGYGYGHTLAVSALIIFVLAMIVTSLGKERRGAVFGERIMASGH